MNTKLVFVLILVFISFVVTNAQKLSFIGLIDFVGCEGQDAGNYTAVETAEGDPLVLSPTGTIIQYDTHGKPIATNSFQRLATSSLPAGANIHLEGLWLVTSGPLAGKWIYVRAVILSLAYLKKLSSILGLSYIASKNVQVLFANKLDPTILISPTGAFDAFKKSACTVCGGSEIVV